MKTSTLRRLGVIILLFLVIGGVIAWIQRRDDIESDELVLFGNVDIRQVELAFFGNERISDVLVEEGEVVHAGQLLATLDLQRFQHKVALAEARYHSQQEIVARLEAGTRAEEIREAKAHLAAAKAEALDASRTFDRVKKLAVTGAKTLEDLDDAKSSKDNAEAQVAAAQAALDLALAGPRKEDIAAAKANLRAREAELQLARRDLDDASLYAPCDGVVQQRLLEVGDMASPEKAVFTIALKKPLWIRAYVDEPDLGKLSPGMIAKVKTDSYPDKTYNGWIGFISPVAEFTPKSVETPQLRTDLVYQVRVFIDDPKNELRLGMPATVIIDLEQSPDKMHPLPAEDTLDEGAPKGKDTVRKESSELGS